MAEEKRGRGILGIGQLFGGLVSGGPKQVVGSDTGVGAEATGAVAFAISGSDVASGAESTAMSAEIPASDIGVGVGVSVMQAQVVESDTGIGADVRADDPYAPVGQDNVVGAEASAVEAAIPASDVGTGAESALASDRRQLHVTIDAPTTPLSISITVEPD